MKQYALASHNEHVWRICERVQDNVPAPEIEDLDKRDALLLASRPNLLILADYLEGSNKELAHFEHLICHRLTDKYTLYSPKDRGAFGLLLTTQEAKALAEVIRTRFTTHAGATL